MRRTLLVAALIPGLLAVAACSGSSGTTSASATTSTATAASPSASSAGSTAPEGPGGGADNKGLTSAQVEAEYQAALSAIVAAHVKGTLVQGGQNVDVDIQVNKSGTSSGSLTANGLSIPFISVGNVGYVQYTASLEAAAKIDPNTQLGKLMLNKWAPSTSSLGSSYYQAIAPMTTWSSMTQLSGPTTDTYTYQGTATVNGVQVAQYKDKSASAAVPDALVSFPVSGPMLPVQMSAGSSGGLSFVWNRPTTVTAPPAADLVTGGQ